MKVKKVGAFCELPHGDKANGLSLRECISTPHEAEAKIIQYLESGVLWIARMGLTRDVLDESSEFVTSSHVLTDGTWVWYEDLAYYVEKYHVQLPNEFIEHMKMNNWTVPPEDQVDVYNLQWCENPTT